MKVSIECTYCGEKWIETIWTQSDLENKICKFSSCKCKNLKIKDINEDKVDYYADPPKKRK